MWRPRVWALVAAIVLGTTLIAGAGATNDRATPGSADLSSSAGIARYLHSLGVDPEGVVVQYGTRNYAGPNCPGVGWNCTTATRVVQISHAGGNNKVDCSPRVPTQDPPGGAREQTCLIIQPVGGTARCFQRIRARGPTPIIQDCTIKQTSSTRRNRAIVIQIVEQPGGSSSQDTTQKTDIEQSNRSASNIAIVKQVVKQSLRRAEKRARAPHKLGASVTQKQESHQSVSLCQGGPDCHEPTGMTGKNASTIVQRLRQGARAANWKSITQLQNTEDRTNFCPKLGTDPFGGVEDPFANMCMAVFQNTTGGENTAKLGQNARQSQRARNSRRGQQAQGSLVDPTHGGGDEFIRQLSVGPPWVGPSKVETHQNEKQTQRRTNTGGLRWMQRGPLHKGRGSTQGANPDDLWRGSQRSTQLGSGAGAGERANLLTYGGRTGGDIRLRQRVNQNGEVTTNECPTPDSSGPNHFCRATIACGELAPPPSNRNTHWAVPPEPCLTTSKTEPPRARHRRVRP